MIWFNFFKMPSAAVKSGDEEKKIRAKKKHSFFHVLEH